MKRIRRSKNKNSSQPLSLTSIADKLVASTEKLMRTAKTEEDLRIGFEKLLGPIRSEFKLGANPKYEKSVYCGRSDAIHGQVIIEYESPNSFTSKKNIYHAYDQLVNYLTAEAKEVNLAQLVGVGFDGKKIFFVHYQDKHGKEAKGVEKANFFLRGPYDFNIESARTFLIYLRALSRLPLNAENLAQKFGPQSELAPKIVSAFANALEYWGNQTHIRTFFNEWKRLFGIVYGEQLTGSQSSKEAELLSKLYQVGAETDFQELLFSIHTYFALLMKLIAAEILTLRETSFSSSLASKLAHNSDKELKRQLEDIENGGIYARKGITNFLEGDFFRWYLDAFDSPELKEAIREAARAFSEFEPATSTLDPASTRDLLKKLYQYLVPQEVRHRLGEYYTPDWLAELLLNEVGYNGNTLKRFLDPACGSGTFLVLAIQRAIKHGREKEKMPDIEIAKRIVANIWGFDLNPLAVIAARTNYLFALGDLVDEILERSGQIEIPVYLTDSILWPERTEFTTKYGRATPLKIGDTSLWGDVVRISTSVREFDVPLIWVKDKGFLMKDAAPLVEKFVKGDFEAEMALQHFKNAGLVFPPHEETVKNFYNQILELEKQNKNGIWARFLKNAFAPTIAGKFDFVIGNPPWIMWQYLSNEYRKATQNLWDAYGLTKIGKTRNVLIRGRREFSTLFTYASADYYLKNGGKLGFLITQEAFKSKGAGEGFRRFQLGDGKPLKILKAHDLVSIQPFEGATNKTAAIILKKGEKTEYPVPYIVWSKKKGVGKIATDKLLEEALQLLSKKRLVAKPIGSDISAWQTYSDELEELSKIEGRNSYKAHRGTAIDPYGVFWLEVKQVRSDNTLLTSNLVGHSRRDIPQKDSIVEKDLIYPGLRGSDITRWRTAYKINVLITHPGSQQPYSEEIMKRRWPRTFNYLIQFRDILVNRGVYKHFHEKSSNPFYGQRDFGEYTFSNHKVIWKRMSNDIFAAVTSEIRTPYGYKKIIPLDTTAFFATDNESEAHYLCAIINSKPVRDFIKSFSSAGRGFGTPSVMEHVGIPKFDSKNELHQKLFELSIKCHQLKLEGEEKEIEKLEKENDELVKELFNIK
jgi:methylase of polypeptide subunit release factors